MPQRITKLPLIFFYKLCSFLACNENYSLIGNESQQLKVRDAFQINKPKQQERLSDCPLFSGRFSPLHNDYDTDFAEPVTFPHHEVDLCGFDRNISATIKWISVTFIIHSFPPQDEL